MEAILFVRLMCLSKKDEEGSRLSGNSSSGKQRIKGLSEEKTVMETLSSEEESSEENVVESEAEACKIVKQLQPYVAYNPYLIYCALEHKDRVDSLVVCSHRTHKFMKELRKSIVCTNRGNCQIFTLCKREFHH